MAVSYDGLRSASPTTGPDDESKKRKIEALEQSELTKEQKRERKRLRKLERKEKANTGDEAVQDLARINLDEQVVASNATKNINLDDKAARKAEKRRLKALKKAGKVEKTNNSERASPNGASQDQKLSRSLSKAERKAEKKRLKALRKTESGENSSNDNSESKEQTSTGATTPEPFETPTLTAAAYNQDSNLSALPQSDIDSFLSKHYIAITVGSQNSSAPLRPIISFDHLPADASLHLKHESFSKFASPTPIQAAAWPFALGGRDVVGVAETGSGKTLAFGVPLVRHVAASSKKTSKKSSPVRAVVVSPTRELALQIHEQLELLAQRAGLRVTCVYGGVPKDPQREALKRTHIVVATPGRLNDLLEEGSVSLQEVSYLVLDEADRMLDKGFEGDIKRIVKATEAKQAFGVSQGNRQTLMFTATWPTSVRELASTFMRDPVRVAIGENAAAGELRANARIAQEVHVVDPRQKEPLLIQTIKDQQRNKSVKGEANRILIFCLYKKEAARVERFLYSKGHKVAGIHGDMSQEKRQQSLDRFKRGETPLLVATDVAARGLDIPQVRLVINMTFPLTAEDYVHRIGRTGRAGADGHAITFFTEHDKPLAGALVNVLRAAKQPVPEDLLKFGTTVKKKAHDAYGAFYREPEEGAKKATKIKFDD